MTRHIPEALLLAAMWALTFMLLNIAHLPNVAAMIGAALLVAAGRLMVAAERRSKSRRARR